MIPVSNEFKENIVKPNTIDALLIYGNTTLTGEDHINSINRIYDAGLFKTCLKGLNLDLNVAIPEKTSINAQAGLLVNHQFEYVNLGAYKTHAPKKSEDNESYLIEAYDKIEESMIDYDLEVEYPISIRNMFVAIFERLGWDTSGIPLSFINSTKTIKQDLWSGINYTFRDCLDELCTIACHWLVEKNGIPTLIQPIQTNEIIDEEFFSDTNVTIGNLVFFNSLVFSRAEDSDTINRRDDESIETNGLHEFKIKDNQLLSTNDREDYIDEMWSYIKNFQYYSFDTDTLGVFYLEPIDKFTISMYGTSYETILLANNLEVTSGILDHIHSDEPEETTTEYKFSSSTDKDLKKTNFIVDKQNQIIESVVSNVSEQNEKISQITQTVDEINSKISDIADITVSGESIIASVPLSGINESEPILLKVRPVGENISYLYPNVNLFPSNITYLKIRTIRFHNNTTNENFDYILPDDLLYYDSENYDEFNMGYETQTCSITKRCKYNADGTVGLLNNPITTDYTYPTIILTEGDYTVSILGYNSGYIYATLMAKNIYTTQFYTKAETDSIISQKSDEININVNKKLTNYSTTSQMNSAINIKANEITSSVSNTYATKSTTNALSTRISQSAKSISLTATDNSTSAGINIKLYDENGNQIDNKNANITLSGLVKFTDLSTQGSTTINGSNITTGTINANLIKSGRMVINGNYTENNAFLEIISPTSTSSKPVGTAVWKNGITSYDYSTDETACIRTESPDGYAELWGSVVNAYGFNNVSLQERKKDFQKLESALDILKDIDIYRYHYKTESKEDKKHIGVVIGSSFKYSKEITNQDNDSIDLYSFVAVCCQAIKEQQKEIEELKKIIKESDK